MAMSAAMAAVGLSPLPPGWTEHTAPTGHKYYYNAALKKSTYQRPILESTQQTPTALTAAPSPTTVQEPAVTPITRPSQIDEVVPLTEWSTEVEPEFEEQPTERQTGRVEGNDMRTRLEDRPRKK
jgi:hypothetical protein